jgi:glucose/arabinose dehydrogenase
MAKGSDLVSLISAIAINAVKSMYPDHHGVAVDGFIVPGSWNASTGEVDVFTLETGALLEDATEFPMVHKHVQLATTAHGHQTPPVGNERVVLIPRHSGFLAIMEHGDDDSPGAPAGESWLTQSTGSYLKLENSGNVALNAHATAMLTAPQVTIGPLGSTQYAVIRTVDLMALVTALDNHIHGPGSGGNTGTPTMPFTAPSGSPDVTCG